jgi:adhesin/invasin
VTRSVLIRRLIGRAAARRTFAIVVAAIGVAAFWAASASAADLAQTDLDVDQVYNVGGQFGYSPFTCPTGPSIPGCGAQKPDPGAYEIGFQLHDESQSAFTLVAGDSVTFTTPARTALPSNPADYLLDWGSTTYSDNGAPPMSVTNGCMDTGSSWDCTHASSGAFASHVDVSAAGNQVTVTLPPGFQLARGDNPAVLVVTGVQNPPAADYSQFDWTVSAGDSSGNIIYDPGFARNDLTIHFDSPFQANCGLTPSVDRSQVSVSNGVALKATVRDKYGNPVSGQRLAIEVPSGSATMLNPPSDIPRTGADGTVMETFIDTLAEPVTFQALAIDAGFLVPQLAHVTFTPGPPDAGHSRLTVSPTTVTADGTSTALVTLDLADQFGNPTIQPANPDTGAPAQGDTVVVQPQLSSSGAFTFIHGTMTPINNSGCASSIVPGGGCTNTETTITRNGSTQRVAQAQFNASDPTAEDVMFEIEDLTAGVILNTGSFAPTIHFVAGTPVVAKSTIVGPSQPVAADGSTGKITVTLADQNGNPVPGVQVTLQQSAGGHAAITPASSTTGSAGQAVFGVSDTQVESVSFTATYSGTVSGQPVSGTVPAPPASGPTVSFIAGGTSASASTAVASSASALANGSASATVTVTLVDGQGNPGSARRVTLTQPAGAHSVITPAAGTTDSSGQAKFTVTDTTIESVTYTATDTTTGVAIIQQPTVSFTATPSVGKTAVSASPSSVPADGTSASTVTVTLLDSNGLPIAGKQLCLTQATGSVPSSGPCSAGPGPSAVTPVNATTDASGKAKFTVTATTPATVAYGVIDLTDYPTGAALGPHASVVFTLPPSEAGLSSITATPTPVLADSPGPDGTSTVTVTLVGPGGVGLANHTVRLDSSSSSSTVTPGTAQTDSSGQAQFDVTDTAVESVTYTATDLTANPTVKVDQKATVTFVPNEAAVSTVAADSPSATADGGATPAGTDHVTVTLDPEQPLMGHHVSLSQSSGAHSTVSGVQIPDSVSGCAAQAPAGTSDCNGQAEFKLTDNTPESVSYTAHDEASGATLSQQAAVLFSPPAPVVSGLAPNEGPVAGGTSVTITGNSLSIGGQAPAVTFGSRAATSVSCSSSSSCTAKSPAGARAGSVEVIVTTQAGSSTPAAAGADTFTYLAAAPKVTKLSPTRGPTAGGTKVTVTGVNFGTLGATTVQFGTAKVLPTSVNALGTQLTVISPAETAGKVDVTVSTPAGTSAKNFADKFTYGGGLL